MAVGVGASLIAASRAQEHAINANVEWRPIFRRGLICHASSAMAALDRGHAVGPAKSCGLRGLQ